MRRYRVTILPLLTAALCSLVVAAETPTRSGQRPSEDLELEAADTGASIDVGSPDTVVASSRQVRWYCSCRCDCDDGSGGLETVRGSAVCDTKAQAQAKCQVSCPSGTSPVGPISYACSPYYPPS